MTFYCYRCNKLIHNASPEFHNNFCKSLPNHSCDNNNNSNKNQNKFLYKTTRRNNNKNNGQISDSIKNNNMHNNRSGRRHNHRTNYFNIIINTKKCTNIFYFNRYNVLNPLKDDDFFLEYLDCVLGNSNNIYNFYNINYSNNSDIIESFTNEINEGNNFEDNTGVNKNILKYLIRILFLLK